MISLFVFSLWLAVFFCSFRDPAGLLRFVVLTGSFNKLVTVPKMTTVDLCVRKIPQNALHDKLETVHAALTTDTGDKPNLDFPETLSVTISCGLIGISGTNDEISTRGLLYVMFFLLYFSSIQHYSSSDNDMNHRSIFHLYSGLMAVNHKRHLEKR